MPESPDITAYKEALERFVVGRELQQIRFLSPFVLRTAVPSIKDLHGLSATGIRTIGKRLVLQFPDELFLVIHLMIAGRLRWKKAGASPGRRMGLACFDYEHGTMVFTEASKKKRASIHLVQGEEALAEHDRGGLDPFSLNRKAFEARLSETNHTLKRALTDPRILSGVGNAYSDEILHAAGLSPIKWTSRLDDDEWDRLYEHTRAVLTKFTAALRAEIGEGFPDKVTAFRDDMAVHGRYGKPCPTCGGEVQRIRYASNETNYCPACQTGGKLLADRSLSRLLGKDWPKTLEALDEKKRVSKAK